MICLGIECTAHTFGIGIIRDGEILANEKDTYTTEKGGIIPTEAAKHHHAVCDRILGAVLTSSGIRLEDVDLIAVANAPGLSPCLLAGMKIAKELSTQLKVPLVGVNHCIAHLEIGRFLTRAKDPVLLYSSGANTQIIAYAEGRYRIFGETLDMGIGNFIDTFARSAGLGFPGGPKIEKLALNTSDKNKLIELPYSIKGMDVSFSGMLTNLEQRYQKKEASVEDLSFSLQETAFAMLIEASERAMAHLHKKELLFGGGVACNSRFQEMGKVMCQERGAKFFCPERPVLVDNGAMIAQLGILMKKHAVSYKNLDKLDIKPYERTDEVEVTWR